MDKTWFITSEQITPLKLQGSEVRYSEALVQKIILEYTNKDDRILDPFAGFGTTLIVGQKLGRTAYGVEIEKERYEHIRKQIQPPTTAIHGSALKLSTYKLPQFDFCMTSPPYMRSFDKENPFSNYKGKGSYKQYLRDISRIYKQVRKVMKPNAVIIIEIENTFGEGHPMTPLVWDVGKELSKIFFLEKEIIHCSNASKPAKNSNHSHILVFRNK